MSREQDISSFETALSGVAVATIKLDRFNGKYRLTVAGTSSLMRGFDDIHALPLVSSGSLWSHALGWRSFFGIPFFFRERKLLAVGVEVIDSQPSSGAYLVSTSYIVEFPLSAAAEAALNRWAAALPIEAGSSQTVVVHRNGLVRSQSSSPEQHVLVERWLVTHALTQTARKSVYWRTLALASGNLVTPPAGGKRLVATVPSMDEAVLLGSSPTRKRLFTRKIHLQA